MEKNLAVARAIVDAALAKGYLAGPALTVVPELADTEKQFFIMIVRALHEHMEKHDSEELSADAMSSLFTFVYAKAAEIVSAWYTGVTLKLSCIGMFEDHIGLEVENRLSAYLKTLMLPEDMFMAFWYWHEEEPDFCCDSDIDPVLPLLEALKWTYRVSLDVALRFFEKDGAIRNL